MNIKVLGIDLAKNVFQLHGMDMTGKIVLRKKVSCTKLAEIIIQLPSFLMDIKACASSHYWARKFQQWGHEVKLISPQFVNLMLNQIRMIATMQKPFVKPCPAQVCVLLLSKVLNNKIFNAYTTFDIA